MASDGQMRTRLRLLGATTAVCLATWLALLAAGNVGLQRSISRGPWTLFEQPVAVVLVAIAGVAAGYAASRWLRVRPLTLLVGVLLGDAVAGLVLAPVLIGELEPIHAPLVFAAVAVVGLQPAAVVVGAAFGSARDRPAAEVRR